VGGLNPADRPRVLGGAVECIDKRKRDTMKESRTKVTGGRSKAMGANRFAEKSKGRRKKTVGKD